MALPVDPELQPREEFPSPEALDLAQAGPNTEGKFVDDEGAFEVTPGTMFHPDWRGTDTNDELYQGPALIDVDQNYNPTKFYPVSLEKLGGVQLASLGKSLKDVLKSAAKKGIVKTPEADVRPANPMFKKPGKVTVPTMPKDEFGKYVLEGVQVPVGERTFNIDWSHLEGDDTLNNTLNGIAKAMKPQMEAWKRGSIPEAKLREMSRALNITEADVLQISKGEVPNAEEALALAELVVGVYKKIDIGVQTAKKAGIVNDADVVDTLYRQANVLGGLLLRFKGGRSEWGRTGHAFQMLPEGFSEATQFMDMVNIEALHGPGGALDRARFIQALLSARDASQVSKLALLVKKSPAMLAEYFINNLVSGPATHGANVGGTLFSTFNGTWERYLAAKAGGLMEYLGYERGIQPGEATEMLFGLYAAKGDAMEAALATLRRGEPVSGLTKFDYQGRAINKDTLERLGLPGRAAHALARGLNAPTTLLMAEDEFFRWENFQAALRAEGRALGIRKGLKGDKLDDFIGDILTRPEAYPSAAERAKDYAAYVLFQRELGPIARGLSSAAQTVMPIRFLLPFIKTPANIAHYNFERFPVLNLMSKRLRDELFHSDPRTRDLAMAKVANGTMMFGLWSTLTWAGVITGPQPQNKSVKELGEKTGWQPFSIDVGALHGKPGTGPFISLNRTDPVGGFIATVATFATLMQEAPEHDWDEVGVALMASWYEMFMSRTWLMGMSNALDSIKDIRTKGFSEKSINFLERTVASGLVPYSAAFAQIAKTIDPAKREVDGMLELIASRTPVLSLTLPLDRDPVMGKPIIRGHLGIGSLNPLSLNWGKDFPIHKELFKNKIAVDPIPIWWYGPADLVNLEPGSTEKLPGLRLKSEERERWLILQSKVRISGKTIEERLEKLIASDDWKTAAQTRKQLLVSTIVHQHRTKAANELMAENDRLKAHWKAARENRANLMRKGFTEREGLSIGGTPLK